MPALGWAVFCCCFLMQNSSSQTCGTTQKTPWLSYWTTCGLRLLVSCPTHYEGSVRHHTVLVSKNNIYSFLMKPNLQDISGCSWSKAPLLELQCIMSHCDAPVSKIQIFFHLIPHKHWTCRSFTLSPQYWLWEWQHLKNVKLVTQWSRDYA